MRGAGWLPAFAAGALFAAAIALALVISSPAATPTVLTPVRSDVAPAGATVGPEVAMARATTTIPPTSTPPASTAPPTSVMRVESAIVSDTTTSTTAAPDIVARGNDAAAQSVGDGCRAKADEWQRRQAAGEVDWSEFERPARVIEDESVWLEPEPFDGRVWSVDERPYVPDFSSGLAVDTLASTDLAYAVEICETADLLPEE